MWAGGGGGGHPESDKKRGLRIEGRAAYAYAAAYAVLLSFAVEDCGRGSTAKLKLEQHVPFCYAYAEARAVLLAHDVPQSLAPRSPLV